MDSSPMMAFEERHLGRDRCLFNRAERVMDGKRIGVLEECSEAERSQNDNLLIPLCS